VLGAPVPIRLGDTDIGALAAAGSRELLREVAAAVALLVEVVRLRIEQSGVETRHSVELVSSGRFGYLLKDRVLDVDDFLDALRRVAAGGSALDPEVVGRLIGNHRTGDPLATLTAREREVLAAMAEGRTNMGIARRLWLIERTVETHIGSIMAKLGLAADAESHRRVQAVLVYLGRPQPQVEGQGKPPPEGQADARRTTWTRSGIGIRGSGRPLIAATTVADRWAATAA
jgi:DNA-binding NarL/FixJ family response regulator